MHPLLGDEGRGEGKQLLNSNLEPFFNPKSLLNYYGNSDRGRPDSSGMNRGATTEHIRSDL
jgi:hypothetical protein